MSIRMHPRSRRTRGFTLVEVLVALVILSVGMLGIAALYVESLRAGKSALLRSQAVMMASDIADRIRANPTAKTAYEKGEDDTGTVTAACNPGGGGCTAAQMAANDIAQWTQAVDDRSDDPTKGIQALPGGRGIVHVDDSTAPLITYTVTVSWLEAAQKDAAGNAVKSDVVVRFQS